MSGNNQMAQLSCPLCQAPLVLTQRTLRCANNHSFDQAKQGYWHLLPVQKKRSRAPGDNAQMVAARTRFLEKGHYLPFLSALCAKVSHQTQLRDAPKVLDMGCGEGYYTAAIAAALPSSAEVIGLDISKEAIKAASRRNRDICWIVASGADIPVPQHSQDILVVLFSRLMPDALAQVMSSGGTLLYAWPGAQHLIELRQAIYEEIKPSRFDPIKELADHFSVAKVEQHNFSFSLINEDELDALLHMTPHGQRMKQEKRQQLLEQLPLTLTFDVNLGEFRPSSDDHANAY